MKYVKISREGLQVSCIALGGLSLGGKAHNSWMLSDDDSRLVMQRAIELGVNFFDTADSYTNGASEAFIGRTWRDLASRDKIVLATKTGGATQRGPRQGALSKSRLFESIEGSLKRLQTDYIDLYQIHQLDPVTPWEETLDALNDLVISGKVRHIGASNILAFQAMKMIAISDANGWTRFSTIQNQYSLAYREEEREMAPLCQMEGLSMIPWSPLARGFLAGTMPTLGAPTTARSAVDPRISEYFNDEADFAVLARLQEIAKKLDARPSQVALAWLISRPSVAAPIVGVSKLNHIEDAVKATQLTLSDDDISMLEEPYKPHQVRLHL
ncbi:aldo/keto reductase [Ochrobactrum teleogrylli]